MPMVFDSNSSGFPCASGKAVDRLAIASATFQDVHQLVDIEFHAFEDEQANHLLSYRDHSKPEHFERSVRLYSTVLLDVDRRSQANSGRALPVRKPESATTIIFQKVFNVDTEEILSFVKAEFKAYSMSELFSPLDVGHEDEHQMNKDWFSLNERFRREYMGRKKHCYIGMLATLPDFQHNGAGTLLLKSILDQADAAGLEVYLEATDTAAPLYVKHGFIAVNEICFDPSAYGVEGVGTERQTVMVRSALGTDGQRGQVRPWKEAVRQTSHFL